MNPIRLAVSRPHTVAVAVILTVLFSWLALQRIPVQLKPTVDTPRISVTTLYRGASAVEVEEQVTRELEDVLQSVEGLVEMTSISAEGSSSITLEYGYDVDKQAAIVDVVNKLSQVPRLPEEADEPVVRIAAAGGSDVVMWIAVRTRYEADFVRRVVEDEVRAKLERVEGISSLFVVGGSEREIQVRIEPELMVAHNVSFDQVLATLARGNRNVRGGTVETASRQLVVRTVGKAVEPAALADLIVAETEGGSVRVGDVAEIVDGYREMAGFVNMNGKPSVAIGLRRQVGANVVTIVEEADEVILALNESFQARGLDIQLQPVYRETTYIEAAIGFVQDNLLLGASLAILVLLVFLRSVRSILIIAVTIPVSLFAVFLVMNALGRTINVISLAGLAFASGMVVDNAVVVLENVFRHLEMGKNPIEAVVDGGREVWGGVLASTLTTVAVFVPILLQSDEASQLFADIAITISAAVAISLVVALTVVPVLISLLYRSGHAAGDGAGRGPLARAYDAFCRRLERSIPGSLGAKLGFVFLVAAGAIASLRLTPPAEYLPTGNRNLVMFFASPIAGTRPEAVREAFRPFEEFVLAQPEFDRMFTVSGAFNGGGIVLKEEYATAAGLKDFYQRLFGPASNLPGFQFFVPSRSSLFQDPGKQFEVELSGPDFESLEGASERVKARLMQVPGVTFVRSSLVTGRPELHVELDEDRAKDLGLDVAEIGRIVEVVVAGQRLSTMIDNGREVDVNVVAPQECVESPEDLAAVRFIARDGQAIALGSVARVTRTTGPVDIRRLERERNVLLTVDIALDAPLESVVAAVEDEVFPELATEFGPAYTLAVGGSADKLKTTLAALTQGLELSVLIVYLLLVSLFRSWLTPLVILVTVPLALSGGILGIRLAGELSGGEATFDVISMLGFVILAGLVVNNAILIVHQANNFRAEGLEPRLALAESARSRLRPILMSVITTVTGMLPLALGGGAGAELYQGLGAVIVGGLLVSTLFTLFLVPVLLSIGYDVSAAWRQRVWSGSGGAVAGELRA
ncbi:MAG: efflux RND transporter permease subunit [Planctomycetota bacterium]|nr:MAG: efflux RND transporter permease subunit [Planctomycetota bacterium]